METLEHGPASPSTPSPAGRSEVSIPEFLSGDYLRPSDVLLMRRRGGTLSWVARQVLGNAFSHAAMVFLVPHLDRDFANPYVIESDPDGVDITNLRDYLRNQNVSVGVLRLRAPWFDGKYQRIVRGAMLTNIKLGYSWGTILSVFYQVLRKRLLTRFLGRPPKARIQKRYNRALKDAPGGFISSGFVQIGFAQVIQEGIEKGELPASAIADVMFRKQIADLMPASWEQFTRNEQLEIVNDLIEGFCEDLEGTAVNDLASSPKLEWKYLIHGGVVRPVGGYDEAVAIIKGG